jgi:hypothetical protein
MLIKRLVIYPTQMGAKGHIREKSDHKKNLHNDLNLGQGIYVDYIRFILAASPYKQKGSL